MIRTSYTFVILIFISACCKVDEPYNFGLRDGFPQPLIPADNPMTQAKVKLGRYIFYDKNLSANKKQSCASCHNQARSFAESLTTSVGSTGQRHRRNSLALVNIAYNKTLTWAHDGLTEIERHVLLPMFGEDPVELGITGHEELVLARFQTPFYKTLFNEAFPGEEINFYLITKALASFVRSLTSFNSPFDRYAYDGDDGALSDSALRGMDLFFSERLECHHCHGGFNFTQSSTHEKQLLDRRPFHNTGLYNVDSRGSYPKHDNGLYELTSKTTDLGRFRAPTLRNIAVTAPYMHDGSIKSLEEVIDFYAAGGRLIVDSPYAGDGRKNPLKDPFVKGFSITAQEKADLLAFLHALSDPSFLEDERHSNPFD